MMHSPEVELTEFFLSNNFNANGLVLVINKQITQQSISIHIQGIQQRIRIGLSISSPKQYCTKTCIVPYR